MAYIRTPTLFSRGSRVIYADICTINGRSSMSFSTVCRWVRKYNAAKGSVINAYRSDRSTVNILKLLKTIN